MKTWTGIFVLWVSICIGEAQVPKMPIYPFNGSFEPYIDQDGYVDPIFDLGNINFGEGFSIPLSLNFSSAIRPPSPEFGQGWDCPTFDSKIYDVQNHLKKVELLGGKEIYLVYNQRTESWKHFYSDDWVGKEKGDDFELTFKDVWKFNFHNGLISSVTAPSGRTINWNRAGDKLMSMGEDGKPPAMQMVYDNLGFAKQILLNPDHLGIAKQSYKFGADLVFAGIDKIHCPDGRSIALSRSFDDKLNPLISWTDTRGLAEKLTWSKETGKILSDPNYVYQIVEKTADNTYPLMNRKSLLTGKPESYYYDVTHGTTDILSADGTLRHSETSVAPGPNYKAIRLVTETKKGVTKTILRRGFDDQGHLVLEAIGLANGKEQIKQYVYNEAGKVVSFHLDSKEMWTNIYDPVTGLLKERDIPSLGVKMAFEKLPGGDIQESIQRGQGTAVATEKIAANAWPQKAAFMEQIH